MKNVIEMRATRTLAGPGVYAYDAEAMVREHETQKEVWLHVNWYDGMKHYTVCEKSMWAFMVNCEDDGEGFPEYLEEYEKLSDAKKSEYGKVFAELNRMLSLIEG